MIDVNAVNVLTIGLIAIIAYAAFKFGARAVGYSPDWL